MAKNTVLTLKKKVDEGGKVTMVTSYDYTMAALVEEAGIDMILVGDSLGNVMQGGSSTLGVTVDDVIYHARCVMRGCSSPFVVVDMPFGSYQVSDEDGVRNGIRILKETGAHAVKLEGGSRVLGVVRRLVDAGVPVMGHLGLTPQSVNVLSGYASIRLLRYVADKGRFGAFAYYCWAAGVLTLVLTILH